MSKETKEQISNYQIFHTKNINLLKILDFLTNKNFPIESEKIKENFNHSLFSPLLYFIIEYLNTKGEIKYKLGKGKYNSINVIYALLNKEIYDIFFLKTKEKIYDEKIEINYIQNEEENYFRFDFKEKELNLNELQNFIKKILNEEKFDINDIENLKKLLEFKKKELISTFKFEFTIQERIINLLIKKANNKIIELPNIIFYEKNKKNLMFDEIDRIVTCNEKTTVSNFLIFTKAEFRRNKVPDIKHYEKGIELEFQKNSCNFIEIKTSANFLIDKNLNKNEAQSINHSNTSNETKKSNVIFKKVEIFKKFFEDNFNMVFENINIIIIIDSYFPKDFIKITDNFSKDFIAKEKTIFDFTLLFLHIESDIPYIQELKEQKNFENELKNLNSKINTITKDSENKIQMLTKDAEKKEQQIQMQEKQIQMLTKDSENKEKQIQMLTKNAEKKDEDAKKKEKEYEEKFQKLQNQLDYFYKKEKLKKIKKKMKEYDFSQYLKDLLKNFNKQELNNGNNILIGNYNLDKFKSFSKLSNLNNNENVFNIIFDFNTFIRLDYEQENLNFEDDIKNKHSKHLKSYSNIKSNYLILLVDFIFMLNIISYMKTYFNKFNLEITSTSNNFFILFLKITNDSEKKYYFKNKIPLFNENEIDLKKVKNIQNFISYIFELNKINENNIKNFPLYDPLNDNEEYYISIEKNNENSEDIYIIITNPLIDKSKINLDIYENENVLLIETFLFDDNEKEKNKKLFKNLTEFFFNKDEYIIIVLEEDFFTLFEDDSFIICDNNKNNDTRMIYNKEYKKIYFKLKMIENKKVKIKSINTDYLFDDKIKILVDSIDNMKKLGNLKILIEEPFNVISTYLMKIFNNGNFLVLNKETNYSEIKKLISTDNIILNKNGFLSYFKYNTDKKFNLIIIENFKFLKEDENMIPKFKKNNLKNIKNHLEENGLLIFHLILKNKYLLSEAKEKTEKIFKKISIKHIYRNEYYVCCYKND